MNYNVMCVMLGYAHSRRFPCFIFVETAADRRTVDGRLGHRRMGTREKLVTSFSGRLQTVGSWQDFGGRGFSAWTSNHLDLRYQAELLESLRDWTADGKRCVAGVFHDVGLALAFADTALLLEEGRKLACGPAKELDEKLLNRLYGNGCRSYMRQIRK